MPSAHSPTVTQTVALIETYYWRYQRIADDAELFREYGEQTDVTTVLQDKELVKYLSDQGVPVGTRVALTPRQVRWIDALCAAGDHSPLNVKLKTHGVTLTEHNKWMKNQLFQRALTSRIESILPDERARVHQALTRESVGGNVSAMKLYLQMTGELQTESNSAKPEVAGLMQGILEILETYVPSRILSVVADDFDYLLVHGTVPVRTSVNKSNGSLQLPEQVIDFEG